MILFYSITFFFGILFSLLILLGKPIFFNLSYTSLGLLNEVLSAEEDDVKASLIQKQAVQVLKQLTYLVFLIVVLLVVFYLPIELFRLYSFEAVVLEKELFYSWQHWLVFSIGSVIPFLPFKKDSLDFSYSETSKLLHRLVLDNYNVGKWLYQKDLKKNKKLIKEEFIIVSGLARSGTTSLMTYLSKQNQLDSLDYSNMPFVLSPNIWRKFYNPGKDKLQQRAHNDGMKIGFSSAEALEEYFFKTQMNDSYIDEKTLRAHEIDYDLYTEYLNYQSLVRKDEENFYLAKNNNFLLRYASVRALNIKFQFVVMLRKPLEHASSLLKQHRNFSAQQNLDSFTLEYMNWLGHHEFGLNQKTFLFDGNKVVGDKNKIDYWLKVWINYYNYLLSIDLKEITLISYDLYCRHPEKHIQYILNKFKIEYEVNDIKSFSPSKVKSFDGTQSLLEEANKVYDELQKFALFYSN